MKNDKCSLNKIKILNLKNKSKGYINLNAFIIYIYILYRLKTKHTPLSTEKSRSKEV